MVLRLSYSFFPAPTHPKSLVLQVDIRIVRNADGNIDTSFILLCQVCQTGIGQTAIWQDNRLVINRKQLCIT